ncbi:hypothetical protein [Sphingomonas sp. TZW2008]|uniref:hypothetical protein n=1 Tax=Sphingomonas sp. TZW2008 TaxID=1917973 RepID=UPI000A271736|nr:hypothetical protein [Sphingomonas sp. TZW2008]
MTKRTASPFLWFDMWMESCTVSLRLFETMAAAPAVVNARMPTIGAAAFDPLHGNWPELYRMVAEKTEAFMQASLSITGDMQAIQSEMLRPMRSAKSAVASSARIQHHAVGAAGRALAPLHTAVTGNARRLQARR